MSCPQVNRCWSALSTIQVIKGDWKTLCGLHSFKLVGMQGNSLVSMVTLWSHGWNSRRGWPICERWHILGEKELFMPGGHALSPQTRVSTCVAAHCKPRASEGWWAGLDSPDGITAPPAHQSDPPALRWCQADPIPMLAAFPVVRFLLNVI